MPFGFNSKSLTFPLTPWNSDVNAGGYSLTTLGGLMLNASSYINWNPAAGTGVSGYGLRDNAGVIEYCNFAGSWTPIPTAVSSTAFTRTGTDIAPTNVGDSLSMLTTINTDITSGHTLQIRGWNPSGTPAYNSLLTVTNTAGVPTLAFPLGFSADTSTLFVNAVNHRVGIGTVTPFTLLNVNSSAADAGGDPSLSVDTKGILSISTNGSNSGVQLNIGSYVGGSYGMWMQAHYTGNGTAYPIIFNPLGGNVGIGTTAPLALLSVGGAGSASYTADITGTLHASFIATTSAVTYDFGAVTTAAAVLDATKYVNVTIGGVATKLAIIQ